MSCFSINGETWHVIFVKHNDPRLMDRTHNIRLGTTDPRAKTVYLSKALRGDLLERVLIHELGHCAMISFGLLNDIHRMTKQRCWVEAEEWVCNFLANYSRELLGIAEDIVKEV